MDSTGQPTGPAAQEGRLATCRRRLAASADMWTAAAIAVGAVLPLFLTAQEFIGSGTDLLAMERPFHVFATTWMARGVLPLWNPYILCGVPFQNGVHGYLYPGWWSGMVLPVAWDIKVNLAAHLALAAAGAAFLARGRVRSRAASALAGVTFALSAFMMLHLFAGHRVMVATAAWLPWLAALLDRAGRGQGRALWWAMPVAGLLVLCGHYQIIFMGLGGVLVHLAAEELLGRDAAGVPWSQRLAGVAGATARVVASAAVGALIAAVQVLPLAFLVGSSQRADLGAEFSTSFSSTPWNLLTYLLPNLYGNGVDAPFVGDWPYWEALGYLGLTPLALALVAPAALGWRRVGPAALVIGLALLLTLGSRTPLFDVYLTWVPGAGLFRAPARFNLLVALFASLLAARTVDSWIAGEVCARRQRLALGLGMALTGLTLSAAALLTVMEPGDLGGFVTGLSTKPGLRHLPATEWSGLLDLAWKDALRAAVFLGLTVLTLGAAARRPRWVRGAGLALVALTAVDLVGFNQRFLVTAPTEEFLFPPGVVEAVREAGGPACRLIPPAESTWQNFGVMDGIGNPGGYDTFLDTRYARYLNRSQGRDPGSYFSVARMTRGGALVDHLGAEFLLLSAPLRQGANQYIEGFGRFQPWKEMDGYHLYRDPAPEPRAALIHELVRVPDEESAYRTLEQADFSSTRRAVIEGDLPAGFEVPEPALDAAREQAEIRLYEPNRVEIQVSAASRGVLVLSDLAVAGWRAEVDGKPVPITTVNRLMRAVPVPRGQHRVTMTYRPPLFFVGATISLVSLAALLAACVATTPVASPGLFRPRVVAKSLICHQQTTAFAPSGNAKSLGDARSG